MARRPPAPVTETPRRDLVEGSILDAAATLFSEIGFGATSMQAVADAVGLSRPSLYHYFKSKDDLLIGMFRAVGQRASDVATTIAGEDLPAADRLRSMTQSLAAIAADRPTYFRTLLLNVEHLPEPLASAQKRAGRAILGAFERVISDGIAAGEFRPVAPDAAAQAIIGMANWSAWWVDEGEADGSRVLLADMAVQSVLNRGGAPRDPEASLALIRDEVARLERHLSQTRSDGSSSRPA